jgi:hypothetical protein
MPSHSVHLRACSLRGGTLPAVLVALFLAGFAGGQGDDDDRGIRITAPMDGWELPSDRPVAVAYFAIWPPCAARPKSAACDEHSESCRAQPRGGEGVRCETSVSIDGKHVLTHALAADNQYSFSGVLPAGALPPGTHRLSIAVACTGAALREAASAQFSVVDPAVWEELGDAGEEDRGADAADKHGTLHTPAAADPLPPAAPAPGTNVRGSHAGGVGVKCAVMVYHANVRTAYEARWMDKSIISILAQTHEDFDIYELNYGDRDSATDSVVQPHLHLLQGRHYTFLSRPLASHAAAMNLLLNKIFADGYDVAFNVNVDDFYGPTRFERQLEAIAAGAHLVSCEFVRITADASGTRDHIHLDYQVCLYVCMCMYVCMCVCMHTCKCIHIYMYVCVCMYVRMHACMHACHACMYVCMYVCMHACMYVCMYVCMHVYTYLYMHVYTYQPTYLTTAELFGERVADKVNAHGAREADAQDILVQLALDHNVFCHPGMAFTRRFWRTLSALQCLHPVTTSGVCV